MLRELRVRGYAVIDEARLELGPGLTVLTGETGAGKSILVGALSLLLGARASSDVVRAGAERALVEGTFEVDPAGEAASWLEEEGIGLEEGLLLLRREVQEGRSRAWANGSRATARLLAAVGEELAEIHGQHEGQRLLRADGQRELLDGYAGAEDLATEVREAHARLVETERRLEALRRRAQQGREQAAYLRFKAEEIEGAGLETGEDERLEAEASRLEHFEKLLALSGSLHEETYGAEESLVERLGALRRPLAELSRIDRRTGELADLAESALAALEELGRRLADYHAEVEHDPERIARVRARLDELARLKAKYHGSLEEVIAAGRAARAELEGLEGSEHEIRALERERAAGREAFLERSARLSELRRAAAGRLATAVSEVLPELGMPAGRFTVALEVLPEPGAAGAERPEFLVTLNPGFEPAPLARVASGGELSRVMLALKTVLAAVDRTPCLAFDEIDAGVGGEVAHRVAERLRAVAVGHQVLVVTHLPQIASRADAHFRVEKVEEAGRPAVSVRRVEGAERVEEVARLLGGDPRSAVSRRHAAELLAAAGTGTAVRRAKAERAAR